MAYTNVYVAMHEEQIIQRLTIAVADVARDVYVEAPATPDHALRMALVAHAGPGTQDFRRFAEQMALLILLLNPALTVASTDGEIKVAVAALWTVYAGLLAAKGVLEVA